VTHEKVDDRWAFFF